MNTKQKFTQNQYKNNMLLFVFTHFYSSLITCLSACFIIA